MRLGDNCEARPLMCCTAMGASTKQPWLRLASQERGTASQGVALHQHRQDWQDSGRSQSGRRSAELGVDFCKPLLDMAGVVGAASPQHICYRCCRRHRRSGRVPRRGRTTHESAAVVALVHMGLCRASVFLRYLCFCVTGLSCMLALAGDGFLKT